MRLLLFGPCLPFRGGIASTTTALAAALRNRGHQLLFLGPIRQYPAFLYPGRDGVDAEIHAGVPERELLYAPLEPWTWRCAFERARDFDADAWIFPYWTWAWAPFFLFLSRAAASLPLVSIVHNPVDHEGGVLRRLASRLVLGRCRAFFTHARCLASILEEEFPGRPVAVHLLPPPPPPSGVLPDRRVLRSELGLADGELLALFFGLIRPYKGVDLLLEAMSSLPAASPWRLVVAGEAWGKEGARLEEMLARLDLEGRVRLDLSWQSEERIESLLAAADLVVLPYRSASQSAVAPLALSRGVPILSTRVGGLSELILDGINGRLVEVASAEELGNALEMMGSRDLEELRGRVAGSVEELTWDSYAGEIEALIGRLQS